MRLAVAMSYKMWVVTDEDGKEWGPFMSEQDANDFAQQIDVPIGNENIRVCI